MIMLRGLYQRVVFEDDEMKWRFFCEGSSSKFSRRNDCFHKCKGLGNFIIDCPLHKQDYNDYIKNNPEKGRKRNLVPIHFKRREAVHNAFKKFLAGWGDTSCESDDDEGPEEKSTMVVEDEP